MRRHLALAVSLSILTLGCATTSAPAGGELTFTELHWLKPQASVEAAREYVRWVRPIARAHGGEVVEVFEVAATVKGDLSPAFVWFYRFPNQAALQSMMADPEYRTHIAARDALWDFDRNELFAVAPTLPGSPLATPAGWLSFVELHWANDRAAAKEYVQWVAPLARRHGGELAQVFEVLSTLDGKLSPSFVWVYRFPDKAAMGGLLEDPEYVAKVPARNAIWDFSKNQLFAVHPSP